MPQDFVVHDPQGTTEAWYQDRKAETPKLACVTAAELPKALAGAKAEGFDFVLIDTRGRDEAAAIRLSDFFLIPCRPSSADMKATPPTVAAIQRLDKPAAFVLTQTRTTRAEYPRSRQRAGHVGDRGAGAFGQPASFQDAQGGRLRRNRIRAGRQSRRGSETNCGPGSPANSRSWSMSKKRTPLDSIFAKAPATPTATPLPPAEPTSWKRPSSHYPVQSGKAKIQRYLGGSTRSTGEGPDGNQVYC